MKVSEICEIAVNCNRLRDILRQNEHELTGEGSVCRSYLKSLSSTM